MRERGRKTAFVAFAFVIVIVGVFYISTIVSVDNSPIRIGAGEGNKIGSSTTQQAKVLMCGQQNTTEIVEKVDFELGYPLSIDSLPEELQDRLRQIIEGLPDDFHMIRDIINISSEDIHLFDSYCAALIEDDGRYGFEWTLGWRTARAEAIQACESDKILNMTGECTLPRFCINNPQGCEYCFSKNQTEQCPSGSGSGCASSFARSGTFPIAISINSPPLGDGIYIICWAYYADTIRGRGFEECSAVSCIL